MHDAACTELVCGVICLVILRWVHGPERFAFFSQVSGMLNRRDVSSFAKMGCHNAYGGWFIVLQSLDARRIVNEFCDGSLPGFIQEGHPERIIFYRFFERRCFIGPPDVEPNDVRSLFKSYVGPKRENCEA